MMTFYVTTTCLILFFIFDFSTNSFLVWLPFIINVIMTSVSEGNTDISACKMIQLYQNSTTEEVSIYHFFFARLVLTVVFEVAGSMPGSNCDQMLYNLHIFVREF